MHNGADLKVCFKNHEFCIKDNKLRIKNDEFCIKTMEFVLKMMNFKLKMMNLKATSTSTRRVKFVSPCLSVTGVGVATPVLSPARLWRVSIDSTAAGTTFVVPLSNRCDPVVNVISVCSSSPTSTATPTSSPLIVGMAASLVWLQSNITCNQREIYQSPACIYEFDIILPRCLARCCSHPAVASHR